MLRLHRRIPDWNLGMQHCLLHQDRKEKRAQKKREAERQKEASKEQE